MSRQTGWRWWAAVREVHRDQGRDEGDGGRGVWERALGTASRQAETFVLSSLYNSCPPLGAFALLGERAGGLGRDVSFVAPGDDEASEKTRQARGQLMKALIRDTVYGSTDIVTLATQAATRTLGCRDAGPGVVGSVVTAILDGTDACYSAGGLVRETGRPGYSSLQGARDDGRLADVTAFYMKMGIIPSDVVRKRPGACEQ